MKSLHSSRRILKPECNPADSAFADMQGWDEPVATCVAHELRSPLTVVKGVLDYLDRDADSGLSARDRELVEVALRSCKTLTGRIDEVVDSVAALQGGPRAGISAPK